MAADRLYGEFYDFYSVSPEYFGYFLVFFNKVSAIEKSSISLRLSASTEVVTHFFSLPPYISYIDYDPSD
jgi:hypothetical protein